MVVYIAFRRGNWLYRLAAGLVPSVLARPARHLVADSWMRCALWFSTKCATGGPCRYCRHSCSKQTARKRGYHLVQLELDASADSSPLVTTVDAPVDKPEAYLLLKVNVPDTVAAAFWTERKRAASVYNATGLMFNFMPWWVRLGPPVGIRSAAEIHTASSFFCSELLTAFLLNQPAYAHLGLVPCCTTPQQLFDALHGAPEFALDAASLPLAHKV